MKNILLTSKYFLLSLLIFAGILSSCKKDKELSNPPRVFRPVFTLVGTTAGSNIIVAKWTNITAATSFTVALSTDSFKTIYRSVVTDSSAYTFENVDWDREYQIRIRSNSKDSASSSGYYIVGGIQIVFPTLLNNITSSDVTDVGVRPIWASNKGNYTSFKIFKMPMDSLVSEISLTAQDTTNKFKEIYGLKPNTSYQIIAYSGDAYKGRKLFHTVPAQIFDIPVDLRELDDATAKTMLTTSYLQGLADGSTIILKRGMTYTITGTVAFQNSITLTTGLGFGNNLATFDLQVGNFDVAASANIAQVNFKDVNFEGLATGYGANGRYIFNISTSCTLGKIIVDGCKIVSLRGVIRAKAGPTTVDTVRFNNCVIDSLRDYGLVNSDFSGALIKNIKITNSTIAEAQKLFVNTKSSGTESIVLQNSTFCYTPLGGNFIMDYNGRTITNGITITNCIFGPGVYNNTTVLDSINGFRGTADFNTNGNYKTADLKFILKVPYPLSGLTPYTGTAATLFKKPDQADFTIKDSNFPGKSSAGDPRWRN